ncbi:MAG: TorF family putative porin [Steroidobacteraceae bacterium]
MTKARVYLAGIALAAAASAAQADITFTPTLTSDYDFRGYTQTAKDPAMQLGVDAVSGPIHVGAWGSNVNFGSSSTELDFVADYTFGSDDSFFKTNTGLVYYTYPGAYTTGSYPEIWVSLSHGWFSVAEHYSWDWAGLGTDANYIEGNLSIPLGDSGFGVSLHGGYSSGQYWDTDDYTDYSIGVTKSFGAFNFALKYVDSNATYDKSTDVFSADGRAILSVSTTLPWAK